MGAQMMEKHMDQSGRKLRSFIYSFRARIIVAAFVVTMGATALYFGIQEKSLYHILIASAVSVFGLVGIVDAIRHRMKERGDDASRPSA